MVKTPPCNCTNSGVALEKKVKFSLDSSLRVLDKELVEGKQQLFTLFPRTL